MMRRSVLLWIALSAACTGCGPQPPLLYCGAGIKPPVAELVEEFNRQHDAEITCDYRGSEVLLSSVKLTGKGDLYMPGDVYYVEMAEKEDLIAPDSTKTVCYFVPIILVQEKNPKEIHTLEDLLRDDVKVGLGDPEVCAIGRTTSEIFAKNGISEADVNVKFRSPTVNELGNHIELKSLDAVIVWDAVAGYVGEKGHKVTIPTEKNVISTVAVAVLKSSQYPDLAAEFVDFITSEKGREVFAKHHFTTTLPE
ncbi:MAG TPA: extracellular solute-binding protein [Thermoguttaceae bacterium]|nr:extracellular solute-binding protein [Thermoguttaceae bacterium]